MTRVLVLPKWYPWPDRPVFGLFCREHARAAALHNDVRVLAFTANRQADNYVGALPEEEVARLLSTGAGFLGTNLDYLVRTHGILRHHGIKDHRISRLMHRCAADK